MSILNLTKNSPKSGSAKATHLKSKDEKPTHLKESDNKSTDSTATHLKAPSATHLKAPAQKGKLSQDEVEHRIRLQKIGNKIHQTKNLDELLINLKDEIADFFNSDRITIFVIDGIKRELVSRTKSGNEVEEIRIPVSPESIAGYTAYKQKLVNIKNVYDDSELKNIDPALKFDKSWDNRTGYLTKQVLALPIIFQKYLMGAIQLINRKDNTAFQPTDEKAATELARIIGIALYKQKTTKSAAARSDPRFNHLLEKHILTQKELDKAIGEARQRKEPVEKFLMSSLKISKKDIGESLAKYYKVPFVEYDPKTSIPGELLAGLKVSFMKASFWVPLRYEGGKILIAVDDPYNLQKIDEIKRLFTGRKQLTFCVALQEDILEYIKLFTQEEKEMAAIDDIISQLQDEADEIVEVEDEITESDSAVVQVVNKMIIDAFNKGTSDIHIEPYPGKQNTLVRIRIDGACTVYQTIPYNFRNAIASRIKIMAGLDIAERRKPQDGKIAFKKYGGLDIELRVATIPTQGGMEDIVMRILAAGEPIALEKLGFTPPNQKKLIEIITQPYGIIFVCGPTGSGKTTTLHSILAYINKTETKIWTAEDPVEITQKGLRQVQVQPKIGFDFAMAMRSFLRADPDVIMVGEMRDKETTSIGIEASLTGHLVFSTLHTNSAPESITRLLDMGMDPFNFGDAMLGICAQRLARTLCKNCKKPYTPSEEEYQTLVREFGGEEEFNRIVNIPYSKDITLYRTAGCEECNNTGYRGRMGVHELMLNTIPLKELIQTNARVEEVRGQALKDGMTTLKQDGIIKVFEGKTDFTQIRKVCIT
jgi:type II secretory ATPase GspE/PulE/Tfp pilus assembly ATPase PilB-like protein